MDPERHTKPLRNYDEMQKEKKLSPTYFIPEVYICKSIYIDKTILPFTNILSKYQGKNYPTSIMIYEQ